MTRPKKYHSYLIIVLLIIEVINCSASYSQPNQQPELKFLTADSILIEVSGVHDNQGKFEFYKALVKGPVCKGGKCHPVELYIYWDLIGNYLKYETLEEYPLEKGPYTYFDENDHLKLHNLLGSRYPSFYYLKKEELVSNTVNDSIDGITGATIASVRDETIPGAIYTCYTLWNIANGPVRDSIRNYTANNLNREIAEQIAGSENYEAHLFLIKNIHQRDWKNWLDIILILIERNEGYAPKTILETMPHELISGNPVQDFLAEIYGEMDYFTKLSLVKRLTKNQISDSLKEALLIHKTRNPSLLNDLVTQIILP